MLIMLPHWTREPALSIQAMEGPVAVACYEGLWNPSVDELHKALGFLPPPIYRSPRQKAQQAAKARLSLMHARAQERLHLPLELHLSEVNWHNSANPQDFCMPTQHSSCLQALQRSKQLVPSADVSADEAASISISLAFGNGYALGLNYAPAVQGPTDGDSALNASIVTAFALGSGFAVGVIQCQQ